MSAHCNPDLVSDNLVAYFDVNDLRCVDASQTISASTRLNNLIKGGLDVQMQSYNDATAYGNMSFVKENGVYVYDQNGINGGYPGWRANNTVTRIDNYTFICWYKYNYGASYQRSNNIYGGGFADRTSFYLSPSGTSANHGVLRYSDAGGTNAYGRYANYGGNDGEWHMFAATDAGGDGAHTTKFFLDGVLKGSVTSNADHDTPDGNGTFTWGSWSGTYGNMNARSNCYMYYNRTLSDSEILHNFNAQKARFGL